MQAVKGLEGWRLCEGGGAGRTGQTASCDALGGLRAARGALVACRTGQHQPGAGRPVEAPSIGRDAHLLQGLRPEAGWPLPARFEPS